MSFDFPPLGQFCTSWDAHKFLDSCTVEDPLDTSSPNQDMKEKMEEMVAKILSSDERMLDDSTPYALQQQETPIFSPSAMLRGSSAGVLRRIFEALEDGPGEESSSSSAHEDLFFSRPIERSSSPSVELDYSAEESSLLSELICPSPQRTVNEQAFARFIEQLPSSSSQEGEFSPSSSSTFKASSPRIDEKAFLSKEDQDRINIIQRMFEIREEPGRARFRRQRKHPSFFRQNSSTAPLPSSSSFSPSPKRLSPLSVEGHIEEQEEIPRPSETF